MLQEIRTGMRINWRFTKDRGHKPFNEGKIIEKQTNGLIVVQERVGNGLGSKMKNYVLDPTEIDVRQA